jgi:gliding motility-associated-like protein
VYSLPTQYTFNAIGVYTVRIIANVTDLTGCSGLKEYTFDVQVVDGVIANFNTTNNLRVCLNDSTRFVDASNGQGFPLTKWQWNFGNSTIDSVKNPVRFLSPAGNYSVSLRAINSLGCYADVTKTVSVLTLPTANFTHNAPVCLSNAIAFNSSTSNGGGGTINNWVWNFGDNTTAAAQNPSKTYTTANTFTVKLNVTTADGCKDSTTRTVAVLPVLTAPVVVTGTITANSIQFNWAAVTGAVGYEISVDGSGFTSPSSGATGLSHVVNGLQPNQTVNITVRALGTLPCQSATGTASGTTLLPDVGIFVPNTFTPNGDGRNDIVRVYGNYIKSLNFQIYNQWGEKVFETNDVNGGWNGMYKNKPQPVGVYVYVLRVENTNGEIVNKRGSINLIK